jgi:two-component system CheB/CheR fusion protein
VADPASPSRKRILVVEDNLDTCHTLAYLLRDMGHKVDFAINGFAALDAMRRFRPDTVLLDLGLPDADGCVLARQLRGIAGPDAVRIVVLSGRGLPEDRERSLSAGCDGYYVKPMDPALLENVLEN